jgi:hypothetical protein
MIDLDTDFPTLYVMIDDFCQSKRANEKSRPGPRAWLSQSEVIPLALFGQGVQFPSERAFYRSAERHLRPAFPSLPDRTPFNRLQRTYRDGITTFGLALLELMKAQECL